MHVISRRPFKEAAERYPNDAEAILRTYRLLRAGNFNSPEEMKCLFPSLDNLKYRKGWWVIDIGGNNLRLIAFISFQDQRLFVKHIVTHTEYDRLCRHYARGGH